MASARELATTLRAVQAIGLTSTLWLAGKTFSQSFTTTPALLLAPAPLLARQWKRMSDSDKWFAPIIVLLSARAFGKLAFREPSIYTSKGILYSFSTVLLLSTLPYSQFLLRPLDNKLEAKAASYAGSSTTDTDEELNVKKEETVHYLVDQWATINLGRTVMTSLAGILATWACLEDAKVVGIA